MSEAPLKRPYDWTNLIFMAGAHLVGLFAIVYLVAFRFSWWTIGLGALWSVCCGLSITGGYHRLFSHLAYKAAWPLKAFYLLFGAASVQNSALAWSGDHRAHHAKTDTEGDPYDIRKGFWWAHVGWVLRKAPKEENRALVRDLATDPLVRFQDRFYIPLAVLMGVVVPGLLGLLWGDPWGAILVAGGLRLVLQWHATFSINSFAHMIGRQPFGGRTTARDNGWLALVTLGEGYHNFHHRFQLDYRNGVRWFHFDPTKWWVWTMSKIGQARDLRRVSAARIAQALANAAELRELAISDRHAAAATERKASADSPRARLAAATERLVSAAPPHAVLPGARRRSTNGLMP